jgi:outer membrane protein OmpA-like peptidoglycan-associated protein
MQSAGERSLIENGTRTVVWLGIAACGVLACARGSTLRQPIGSSVGAPAPEVTLRAMDGAVTPARTGVCAELVREGIAFPVGSTVLSEEARRALKGIARCASQGPLRDATLLLLGQADPSGDSEDNLALGYGRALRAKEALLSRGVAAERVVVVTSGEQRSQGAPREAWAGARIVEIVVLPRGILAGASADCSRSFQDASGAC